MHELNRLERWEHLFSAPPSTLVTLQSYEFSAKQIKFYLKCDHQLHPFISGNKWRKLKYILHHAIENKFDTIVSFGGAYSNYLHALSAACAELDLHLIALVRGEETKPLNPCLQFIHNKQHDLVYLSRNEYIKRYDADYIQGVKQQYPQALLVPEGGFHELALKGMQQCVAELQQQLGDWDYFCLALGSGGTTAGVISASVPGDVWAFAALKQADYLQIQINKLLSEQGLANRSFYKLFSQYARGGFAKIDAELVQFCIQFYRDHGILLDPIYTGKAMMGLFDRIAQGDIANASRVVFYHSGGLQAWFGYLQRQQLQAEHAKQISAILMTLSKG